MAKQMMAGFNRATQMWEYQPVAGAPPETEEGFQAAVMELATLYGWTVYHTWDSRRSGKGFPDLVLGRRGQVIFAELKTAKGTLTSEQLAWIEILTTVPGIEVHVWRPAQFGEIERALRRP